MRVESVIFCYLVKLVAHLLQDVLLDAQGVLLRAHGGLHLLEKGKHCRIRHGLENKEKGTEAPVALKEARAEMAS